MRAVLKQPRYVLLRHPPKSNGGIEVFTIVVGNVVMRGTHPHLHGGAEKTEPCVSAPHPLEDEHPAENPDAAFGAKSNGTDGPLPSPGDYDPVRTFDGSRVLGPPGELSAMRPILLQCLPDCGFLRDLARCCRSGRGRIAAHARFE